MVAMTKSAPVPSGYAAALAELKRQVRNVRFTAQRRVNTELVRLYWGIGATILQRQEQEGWGTNVIGRLADDLRAEFPEMTGFSSRNLSYMRAFAAAWADSEVVQQAVADLPWGRIPLERPSREHTRGPFFVRATARGGIRAAARGPRRRCGRSRGPR
jgi:predicted nuclease of restriction endonuclease-like (RecB) superfamily